MPTIGIHKSVGVVFSPESLRETLEAAGIALTNSTGIHGDIVGGTTLGYILSFARGLHRYHERDRENAHRHATGESFTNRVA